MMGLLSWAASRLRKERVFVEPEQLVPPFSNVFGPQLSQQPSHEDLLRENRGVADMATRAIANRIASLDLEVFTTERVEDGTTTDVLLDDHPAQVLLNKPNPNFSTAQMLRLSAQYITTVGEAYWLKVRSRLERPVQLDVMPPGRMRPLVERNVIVGYVFLDGFGAWREIPADAVIRFWFPDPESMFESEGYLGPNATVLDAQKFSEQHLSAHYQHNAIPPAVVKSGSDSVQIPAANELERWREEWTKRYHRRMGTHQGIPAWLPSGWDIVFAAAQSGADVTPILEWMSDNQLMNFGVPKSVLGKVVSGDRSSAETNQYVFDLHTIKPITDMMADSLTMYLASEFDPALKIRFKEFLQRNTEEERAQEAHDLDQKIRTINEIRVLDRGEEPVEWGDLPVGQIAEVPYDGDQDLFGAPEPDPSVPEPEPETAEDEEPEEPRARAARPDPSAFGSKSEFMSECVPEVMGEGKTQSQAIGQCNGIWEGRARQHKTREERRQLFGMRALLYEELFNERYMRTMRRIFRAQERKTLQRYKGYAQGDDGTRSFQRVDAKDLFSIEEWHELFERALSPVLREIYTRVGTESMAATSGGQFIFTEQVISNIEGGIQQLVEQTGNTTYAQLTDAIERGTEAGESVDQIANRIRGVFADASRKRARTIARTETLRATQAAQQDAFEQSGVVTHKEWNTSLDQAVRESHRPLEGEVIKLNDEFDVDGEPARGPGDPRLSAGNVINCRCFLSPVFADEVAE